MIVTLMNDVEVVEGDLPDYETMTAELYVQLLAQDRISPTGLFEFGTTGRGRGVVTYRLTPLESGRVQMERVYVMSS